MKNKYFKFYDGFCNKKRREKALDHALDIRKFEIELYWKRATYFWAFIAVTFAGYFSVSVSESIPPGMSEKKIMNKQDILLLISCIGFVFSIAWYFVNRASKFWQNNWERHVDLLEDEIIGPLYKTRLEECCTSFWKLNNSYKFSVSKINQLLSLFVVLIFFLLLINVLITYYRITLPFELFPTICLFLTVIFICALYVFGKQDDKDDNAMIAKYRSTTLKD